MHTSRDIVAAVTRTQRYIFVEGRHDASLNVRQNVLHELMSLSSMVAGVGRLRVAVPLHDPLELAATITRFARQMCSRHARRGRRTKVAGLW